MVRIITDADFTAAAIHCAARARTHLLLVQYLFVITGPAARPTPRIADELYLAAERGVTVRILLNRFSHGRAAGHAPRTAPLELCHKNIDLRYHTSGQVLHSKVIVSDAEMTLTGSHNLSHFTLARSHNLSLLILDRSVAAQILSIYDPMFGRAERAAMPRAINPE